jgi:hypothetical protein
VSLFKSSLVFDFWIFPLNHQLIDFEFWIRKPNKPKQHFGRWRPNWNSIAGTIFEPVRPFIWWSHPGHWRAWNTADQVHGSTWSHTKRQNTGSAQENVSGWVNESAEVEKPGSRSASDDSDDNDGSGESLDGSEWVNGSAEKRVQVGRLQMTQMTMKTQIDPGLDDSMGVQDESVRRVLV